MSTVLHCGITNNYVNSLYYESLVILKLVCKLLCELSGYSDYRLQILGFPQTWKTWNCQGIL